MSPRSVEREGLPRFRQGVTEHPEPLPDTAPRRVWHGQGRGADLCSAGTVLDVPWTLADGLSPAHTARGPQLSLQRFQVLLMLGAGSPLLSQLLPQGLCKRKSIRKAGAR